MQDKEYLRPKTRRLAFALRVTLPAVGLGLVAAVTPSATVAAADQPQIDIGRSVVIVNLVKGQYGNQAPKELKINDDIVFQEDIYTGTQAKTVIEFRDGSTFELGANAVARIDSFIYNPRENTSHKTLSITSGAFRYLSGSTVRDQDTKIATSSGTLGIRGSIVSGFVAPQVPVFLHVTEGDAEFTNDAGGTNLHAGNSIAVPSRNTKPMRPDLMPCPIAEQALRAIMLQLPPDQALRERPPPSRNQLKRQAEWNKLSVSQQRQLEGNAPAGGPGSVTSGPPIVTSVDLLTEAAANGTFNGAQKTLTAKQKAFVGRVIRDNPDACADIEALDATARELRAELVQQSTTADNSAPPSPPEPPAPPAPPPPGGVHGSSPSRP
jgi:hypothetical protein